jgi:hypothetical protein
VCVTEKRTAIKTYYSLFSNAHNDYCLHPKKPAKLRNFVGNLKKTKPFSGIFRALRRSASTVSEYQRSIIPQGRCDIIRLGSIPENNGGQLRKCSNELEEYARQYEPLYYYSRSRRYYHHQQQHGQPPFFAQPRPVKNLVSAYNEQILRRQHNSAYATLCVTSQIQNPIYANIHP